jgi:TolA-binding protein
MCGLWSTQSASAQPPTTASIVPAAGATAPATPTLPADVVFSMQGGDFDKARAALGTLRESAKSRDDGDYYGYLQGIAERLAGRRDAARDTLRVLLTANPNGRWAPKIRYEIATIELASGNWAAAEELTRSEAIRLLAGPRKDQLAAVYENFAERLLEPNDPLIQPDPNGAYELLTQARELAESPALRARLLFAMGRASLTAQNPARAIENLEHYLGEYRDGADRFSVRLQLGEAQRRANQLLAARLTWTDLARDIERLRPAEQTKPLTTIRADALFEIATTFGVPKPPDDASLNQGVASLRRFMAAFPSHTKAVRAAFWIGESYRERGKSSEALDAYTEFLKESGFKVETELARRDWAEHAMAASFHVGEILQGQQRFAEAIAAWKGYLARYPNGPQTADAERSILDTQLLIAAEHESRGRHAEARRAWNDFVSQNPLDARVPQILYLLGETFGAEKKPDQAIAAWEPLISRFPTSEPAAHAQFRTASYYENEKGNLPGAIERFKKIGVEPWATQARQRIAVMEAKALVVITPRTFRSGENAHLQITTRNIEKLTFNAYKLSAEAYYRKKFLLDHVESLDIGLVAPDASWTIAVADYARYKPVEHNYELKALELPGVYVVRVTDEKSLQATTLVIGSDVDAIVKSSPDQILVFVQDMKTGSGRAGAKVLVADGGQVVLEGVTGEDGVLLSDWTPARAPAGQLSYLVFDGAHVAGSWLGIPSRVAQGLSPRAYLYTDRPAYRPGQNVSIRGVVREVAKSQYANTPGASYRLEVTDSRGRLIVARSVKLSEFGTFHESLALAPAAPVGDYRIRVFQPGKSDFAGSFQVDSYRLEPIDLGFNLKRIVFFRGETIQLDVSAQYQYGAAVANRPIEVNLPDGRVLRGTTDTAGKYHFELSTEGFSEEQSLHFVARLPEDNVAASATVKLAVRAFEIKVHTARDVYLAGESFALEVTTTSALGEPDSQTLSATLLKQVPSQGRVIEREVAQKVVKTDPKTGRGRVRWKVDDAQGGRFLLRVAGTDRFGNPIVADSVLTISGTSDEIKLRLLADRQEYKVGEEAAVNLHSRGRAGTALLTWEADRVLKYRIVPVREGDNAVSWSVDGAQFPNFTLTATRMWQNQSDQARLDIKVERDLRVIVTAAKGTVGPGEPVDLDVTAVDQLGRPVAAELSIAMVDQALLRVHGDKLPEIGPFFYNQVRTGAFATESTNTFRYTPAATVVSRDLVEESEAAAAIAANLADRASVMNRAERLSVSGGLAYAAAPLAAPAPAPPDDAKAKSESKDALRRKRDGKLGESVEYFEADATGGEPKLARFGKSVNVGGRAQAPRERFTETAYWNPRVVTGSDGKARVAFKAPTSLSTYRITARGITAGDTLAGQTTTAITVRKNFFVDLKLPGTLTQGDKPRFMARVHHTDLRGKLTLRLAVYAGGRDEVFPKTIDLAGDGVDQVLFDPFEVPETDSVRLTLTGSVGDAHDELVAEVPVRPWGVEVMSSESGTSSDSSTVFVGLPPGRTYDQPELSISVAPSVERMLIELALGDDVVRLYGPGGAKADAPGGPLWSQSSRRHWLPCPTTADRASELLAATSALDYLRSARATAAPEAQRVRERANGLVATLVAAQNEDGGWPWVTASPLSQSASNAPAASPSDRMTSAAVAWALATAEPLGLVPDLKTLDSATAYLKQQFAKTSGNDYETRAAILHALSARRAATFEAANAVNRSRDVLSNQALAHLALTFANLDRATLADEVIGILTSRAKTEAAGPGKPARVFWSDSEERSRPGRATETTALAALAVARVRPRAPELDGAVRWLMAHRTLTGWRPHKAIGPALAALAVFHGQAARSDDRYRLTVSVNETEVARIEVAGPTSGQMIVVPRRVLKLGAPNRVRFDMEGRGSYGYAIAHTGFARDLKPEQDRRNRTSSIHRRVYFPAPPEVDGKAIPIGFGVAVNAAPFENLASQVALGGRATVALTAWRDIPETTPEWERDFLILEEHLPAGATLIDGSVKTTATSYDFADGVLTLYFAPSQNPGTTTYDIHGYLPGQYRALPASIRSAYEPGRFHLGTEGQLRVRSAGEPNTDPYKPTPDELYALGKAHFDAGRIAEADAALEPLFSSYTLRDDVARDAARMLLLINIQRQDPRQIVQYFEVVKEKAADLVLSFDQLLAIGKAYRDLNEYERAMIVWRGLIEASYLADARVGELLRQRGKTLESISYLIELWRSYPNTASIETDFFGLSQVVNQTAARAFSDPALRRELAVAGVTRSSLLLQSILMIEAFLAQSPKNPVADEASLALVGAFTDLEDFKAVERLATRFAKLYPKSSYQDSFQFSVALADFHLGQYDRAIDVALAITRVTYKDAMGVDQPSPNKWQAFYILGQIHDARRQPAKAIEYYRQVADRYSDAASAIQSYTRKELKVPEVSVVRAADRPAVAGDLEPGGFRVVDVAPAGARPEPLAKPGIALDYRNVGQVDVKVYPVDLMQLYLTRRNLNDIASIDLAGVTPLVEKTVALGASATFEEQSKSLDLPITKAGAYLTMIRGDNLYASGIVLVTPLEIEVLEGTGSVDPGQGETTGRVRVTIRDARTKEPRPKVQVKVTGSEKPGFISGTTDLRGVFVAEGVTGLATVVAHTDGAQYAFYRGKTYLNTPVVGTQGVGGAPSQANAGGLPGQPEQALDANVKLQNTANSLKQIERLQQRFNAPAEKGKGAPAGGFR